MNSAHSSHWKSVFPVAILGAAFVITSAPTLHGEQGQPRVFITGYRHWTSSLEVTENSIVNVTARLEQ